MRTIELKKIVHEWNGRLEIFSPPQAKEISGEFVKTVFGCPCSKHLFPQICKKDVSLRKMSGKYESIDNCIRSCVHQIKMLVNSR